jgi:hypothetical protein
VGSAPGQSFAALRGFASPLDSYSRAAHSVESGPAKSTSPGPAEPACQHASKRPKDPTAHSYDCTAAACFASELKVSTSPPAAVRHALDVAGNRVDGLLHAAREAADEITASAQQEAEESTARVKAAAAELVVNTSTEADRMVARLGPLLVTMRAPLSLRC